MSFREYNRRFSEIINVVNSINFCSDKVGHLMIELKELFESKCYSGCYILEITRIITMSACNIDLLSQSTIDVVFEARVIQYKKWGIITNVKITDNLPIVVGETEYANVTLLNYDRYLEIVKIGQVIPVRIYEVRYEIMKKISIVALPLMPDKQSIIYNIPNQLSVDNAVGLMSYVDRISNEMKLRENLNPEELLFYEQIFNSEFTADNQTAVEVYDGGNQWYGPVPKDTVNITNMISSRANGQDVNFIGLWTRSIDITKTSPFIRKLTSAPKSFEINSKEALVDILENILIFLVCIRELVELHGMESNNEIWEYMRGRKIKV